MRRYWIAKYGLLVKAKKITPIKREFIKVDDDEAAEKLLDILAKELNKAGK